MKDLNSRKLDTDFRISHTQYKHTHESPNIPNYGKPNKGTKLKPGMVLAIEPMINQGSYEVYCLSDGWTIVTADGKNSAHYEHTIAITEDEPLILTSL